MPLQNDPPSPWLGAFKEKNIPQPIQAMGVWKSKVFRISDKPYKCLSFLSQFKTKDTKL